MEGDWIGLYEHDPTMNPTLPLRRVSISTISGYNLGYYKTDVQFSYQEFDRELPIGDSCLGYWIGYIRNGATIAANCLKIRPSWMWQNRGVLGSVPIKKFFLPGTHNSGSYKKYEGSLSDTVVSRYSICQDEDIWSQLVYGVRYLDIRVGYYPNRDDKFWMNHDLFRINPLRFLLEDLRNFLRVSREIVILDFHRFPVGFNQIRSEEIHMELVTMIVSVLGDFMVPSRLGSHATLNDLWHLNRTLIVTYADDWTRRIHPLLWPSIPQEWGDKKTAEDLFIYLQGVDRKRVDYTYFWAAMAELTPTTSDIIFRARDGLRKFQDTVARNITTWYRDLWWKTTSIVAVDFFHSTDIIDVAVEANLKSVQCSNVPFRQGTTTSRSVRSSPNSQVQQNRRFYQGPRSIPSQQPSHFLRS